MRTLKLVVQYDGSAYSGWQRQPGRPTVQQALEDAIAKVIGPHRTVAAGRTDAGVHALGQVVAVRTGVAFPAGELHRALNALLPADVAVVSIEVVSNEFDPRRDAVSKLYRYRLFDRPVRPVFERAHTWHVWNVDWDRVEAAARHLVGTHDFASFQGAGADHAPRARRGGTRKPRSTVRTIHRLDVIRDPPRPDEVWLELEGNGFLKQMVRNLVGSLLQVGRGLREPAWIEKVLAARDRTAAGPTAPASGLTLVRVEYAEPPSTRP